MTTLMATLEKKAGKQLNVGQAINTIRDVIEANAAAMFQALPKHITPDRFMRVVLSSIRATPKLLDCTPASFYGALTEAATYGLEPGTGAMAQAYLIPYKEECVLVPGYRGLLSLAYRSGEIASITCESVYKGDEFHYQLGDTPHIQHVPSEESDRIDPKEITHVYVVVHLKTGGVARSVWPRKKIDAHGKKYSPAYAKENKDCVWITNWEVAAKKTLLRDIINRGLVPVSVELQGLSVADEYRETMKPTEVRIGADSLAALTQRLTGDQTKAPADPMDEPEPPPKASQTRPREDTGGTTYTCDRCGSVGHEPECNCRIVSQDPHQAAGDAAADAIGDQTPAGSDIPIIIEAKAAFADCSTPKEVDTACEIFVAGHPLLKSQIADAAAARKAELYGPQTLPPPENERDTVDVLAVAKDEFRAATALNQCGDIYKMRAQQLGTQEEKDKLNEMSLARQDEIRGKRAKAKSNE